MAEGRELANLTSGEVQLLFRIFEKLCGTIDQDSVRKGIGEDLLRLLKSDFLASFIWNQNESIFDRFVGLNVDNANIDRYLNYWQFHDPIESRLRERACSRVPRGTHMVAELISQKDLEKTEFFNEFLMRDNHHHGLNVHAYDGMNDIGDLRIWRTKARPEFTLHEVSLVDTILPYFRNALRNARILAEATSVGDFWQQLVENSAVGVFLFDSESRLIWQNQQACKIEEELTPYNKVHFRGLLDSIAVKKRLPTQHPSFSLSILQTISPIDSRPVSAVFASRADMRRIDADALKNKHLLTSREAEVCVLVCKGLTTREIGAVLKMSSNTVKTHLKRIFERMDVTTRSELVYRLLSEFLIASF
jgi:DNA-binding CsgD family transcriptional regulator/PAS domain-containing protein